MTGQPLTDAKEEEEEEEAEHHHSEARDVANSISPDHRKPKLATSPNHLLQVDKLISGHTEDGLGARLHQIPMIAFVSTIVQSSVPPFAPLIALTE
jgi:hypothetical protein